MKICDSWMETKICDRQWMKTCVSKVDENLSTTLARNKLPVVAPEAMALLHARARAGKDGGFLCVRVWTFDSSCSSSSLRICGLMQIWFSKKLPWSAFFFSVFFFFFLGWQFCVVAKVAILDSLQDLARFGYKLNIKVMFYKNILLYFWLETTYLKHA